MYLKKLKELKFISAAAALEESAHMRVIYASVATIVGLLVLLILWAAFTQVDEVAAAKGTVAPQGNANLVEHYDGGLVQKVLVKNGEYVEANHILLVLDNKAALAELEQAESREVNLILDITRLHGFISGKSSQQIDWKAALKHTHYAQKENTQLIDVLINHESQVLTQQEVQRENKRAVLASQIQQNQLKYKQTEQQETLLQKQVNLFEQEYNMYAKLNKTGTISRKDFLQMQREMIGARGQLSKIMSTKQEVLETMTELKNRLSELDSNLSREALREADTSQSQLVEVRHTIERLQARLERLTVRAPIGGVVKGLTLTPGSVVDRGGELMELVPVGREFIVKAKLKPRDIAYVSVGDPVKIKVTAYDFARYGSLNGEVENISASTFVDNATQETYYEAVIAINKNQVGDNKSMTMLKSGMTAEADIITGRKSVLAYLLRPVYAAFDESFRER